jgi:hypothetical protein
MEYTADGLHIFPNPAGSRISVEYGSEFDRLSVIDFSGRVVKTVSAGSVTNTTLELGDLPDGMYILRLSHEGNPLAFGRFMKQ